MWENYLFTVPEQKRVRYIIHTDAKNEADDQFTIAHALMTDKLDVKGIIAGHFAAGNKRNGRFTEGTTATESLKEIDKILDLMHLTGKYPVLLGAQEGLVDENTPIVTEAAKFIVEEAMKDDPRPLYIGMQGAITDLACAILMEPRICERMTCIWIGGGDYPDGGEEFNLMNDIIGANVVFNSSMPVWQVARSTYKQFAVSLIELQVRVRPYGKIGNYLFQQLIDHNMRCADNPRWPHGEIWGLGDEGCIAALMQETGRTAIYEEIPAPRIAEDMTYIHEPEKSKKNIRVYKEMDYRLDLEDFFLKLQVNFPEKDS